MDCRVYVFPRYRLFYVLLAGIYILMLSCNKDNALFLKKFNLYANLVSIGNKHVNML